MEQLHMVHAATLHTKCSQPKCSYLVEALDLAHNLNQMHAVCYVIHT